MPRRKIPKTIFWDWARARAKETGDFFRYRCNSCGAEEAVHVTCLPGKTMRCARCGYREKMALVSPEPPSSLVDEVED